MVGLPASAPHREELGRPPGTSVTEELSDLDVATGAARGDREAQRALVRRVLVYVRTTVGSLSRARGASDAEDAVQSSMIEVLRSAGTYRGDAPLDRWAGRIAARTTVRLLRERRAREERAFDEDDPEVPEPRDPRDFSPSGLSAHLASLPEARRTCLVLHYVHGYSVQEVATLTHTSPNTVKDRLLQARAELRRAIDREELGGRPSRRP
jgi:RNA polymerase sigma-70 factor, ECF subfamily